MLDISEDLFLLLIVFLALITLAIWLALAVWTSRDIRARSRDRVVQGAALLLVLLLNLPGLLIYLLLRPRESLAQAYERSLEEEALLQDIEERPSCPACSERVQPDWQACPYCYHRLKKPCIHCEYLLELSWNVCPKCTATQVVAASDGSITGSSRHVQPSAPAPIDAPWIAAQAVVEQTR